MKVSKRISKEDVKEIVCSSSYVKIIGHHGEILDQVKSLCAFETMLHADGILEQMDKEDFVDFHVYDCSEQD